MVLPLYKFCYNCEHWDRIVYPILGYNHTDPPYYWRYIQVCTCLKIGALTTSLYRCAEYQMAQKLVDDPSLGFCPAAKEERRIKKQCKQRFKPSKKKAPRIELDL